MISLPDTITARLRERARRDAASPAYLFQPETGGAWCAIGWQEVAATVDRLAYEFARLGLSPGDRIAIMLPTCPEWEFCHHAALAAGGVVVGLDRHDADTNLAHILLLTEPRIVIAQATNDLDRLSALWGGEAIGIVASANAEAPARGRLLSDLLASRPETMPVAHVPQAEDTATIVFTSGSTGTPKGIAYSHRQITLAVDALIACFPSVRNGARTVCWLPLANLFQRILNLVALNCGAHSYFVGQPDRLVQCLPEIRPTLFVGVPRFYEKLHQGIVSQVRRQPLPLRIVVEAAWDIGCRHAAALRDGRSAPPWVRLLHPLSRSILQRIRLLAGPELQFMVSGSAALPPWLLERFHGLGWLVLEAYGISENVVPMTINRLDDFRFGSVGRPLPGNQLRIADDGELLVRGPGVFRGYYRDTAPADSLDGDGFLHTGDFARLDDEGRLWLEGRKSEIFKTSTGRRVAPVPIETALKQIDYVDHAVAVGRNRPFPIAILTLDAQSEHLAELDATARARIANDVASACAGLPVHQHPGALIVSRRPLSVADGELTANLKLRRARIEERFAAGIDRAYADSQQAARTTLPIIEMP
ncbi:AMP-dependent synthetase/ligase [Thauera linaloolentis]|uniref:Putative long chain fatty acid CoA ligase n=1 Tax=Thauera linaloolentis (strain DSM 12138 / JCM 21573 / CCUG 41526 / CIP 105981 / IAM 15112 / NBRC 102519 / 47Lol) TaxID=1123367 RepID=N6Z5G7_THAL4|nr:AMP-binding protein [Thauera linaloolentis]ENO89802.1 putative long chain fatty acid CoA ligase [Thauera linaloolentis 47Lol = DSM 12138]MCM8567009.1 AMP-binding protein [Thauera linaloolentis]